ncbi:zinc finger and SCAN domain-containing protein 31 [Stomoxys calcitrans]|uniref:zinc finger and SCAN domain-containing protein 31 n=1 Tax=Stomoxys calcitrans TaxID=35570 RepID=UPI0027E2FA57|nr:zinc finger and SCAN domain-containing protein 31 [Stomoxys calcitrans]
MCVVIDLDVVCLVCLHHSAQMHSVFSPGDDDAGDIQIAQKISTLSKLKLDANNESLPDKICDSCLQDLTAAWRFHRNCQTAVAVFQSILKPIVQKKVEPPAPVEELAVGTKENTVKEELEQSTEINSCADADEQSEEKEEDAIDESIENHQEMSAEECSPIEEADDEFMEMNQNIAVDNDDYQSAVETPEEESEVIEYYVTEDGLHEITSNEEIQNRITASNVEHKKETSTIASKKLVMNSTRSTTTSRAWPFVLKKTTQKAEAPKTATTRSSQQLLRNQKLSKVGNTSAIDTGKATPKQVKERSQTATQLTVQCIKGQQEKQNGTQLSVEKPVVKSARKRRAPLPLDAKPPKICEICGNSYRFQHALNAHMRRHYQDKPFPCEMCEKAFVSNVELRRHMRVHTGHKPYGCQYCERRFSDFGSRIKHERTHTGERPYVCNTCGKAFAYPHVLSVHLRTHTGEKKFRCDFCVKGFTKKAYLLSHIEQHHGLNKDITTYELAMDDDEGTDAMEDCSNDLAEMKNVKFDDCIFTPEFGGETHDIVQQEDDGDVDESYDEDDGNKKIIVQKSLLRSKIESSHPTETDVQEVEIHLDEYTIRVR